MDRVVPQVYLIAEPSINLKGIKEYLWDTQQEKFMNNNLDDLDNPWPEYKDPEILTSFAAKVCYKSLVQGMNDNISRTRNIANNLGAIINSAHGSVLEHCNFTFMLTNVSRVLTHELIRHRAGTAFSQTSGRYVREDFKFVECPILSSIFEDEQELDESLSRLKEVYEETVNRVPWDDLDFDRRKAITSALRRLLPNGLANEIVLTINIRALRHTIQLRTSRHAEFEIRFVFDRIYHIMKEEYPRFFFDAIEEQVDGLTEVRGMRTQPYEYLPPRVEENPDGA